MKKSRILVFGAGVIGSIYAGRLALCGLDVTILARSKRLLELREKGLLLKSSADKNAVKAPVSIIEELEENDFYDYVYVIVRKDQVETALPVLSRNKSATFIFMVNTSGGYTEWINALGKTRVVSAFPGAGGKIENGVVKYSLTSKFIQPTTLGEIDGRTTARLMEVKSHLSKAGFPTLISKNMETWQKTHIAMVAPLAMGIYYDGGNNYTFAKNRVAIKQTNLALKEAFNFLKYSGIGIEPPKLNAFRLLPISILNQLLSLIFNTKWAETVISNHAIAAKNEMDLLTSEFLLMAKSKGYSLLELEKMRKKS